MGYAADENRKTVKRLLEDGMSRYEIRDASGLSYAQVCRAIAHLQAEGNLPEKSIVRHKGRTEVKVSSKQRQAFAKDFRRLKSIQAAAIIHGIDSRRGRRWLEREGVLKPNQCLRRSALPHDKIIYAYVELKKNTKYLAKVYRTAPSTIARLLSRHGVTMRGVFSPANRQRRQKIIDDFATQRYSVGDVASLNGVSYSQAYGILYPKPKATPDGRISGKHFDKLMRKQKSRCAICRSKLVQRRTTHVDHCHTTGKIRGLLCHTCNVGLGYFKDDASRLKAAATYIECHAA